MISGSDSEDPEIANESPIEAASDDPAMRSDSGQTEPRPSITVRRKRRRRNVAPFSTEYSRTHANPPYIAPEAGVASERRRRRSRRRFSSRNFRRALRSVMFIAIQVVFIMLLVFLWMKISAKVNE